MSKFKVLGLNWCQKSFQNQIDVNFKVLGLKRLFTLNNLIVIFLCNILILILWIKKVDTSKTVSI